MLGCEQCVDRWYSDGEGRTRNCPLCRCEWGLPETSHLNGLDDFLAHIAVLFDDSEVDAYDIVPTPPNLDPSF